jgi:hypothetical protein
MRWLAVCLLTAGCIGSAPGGADEPTDDGGVPGDDPSRVLEPGREVLNVTRVVLDHNWSHENLGRPPLLSQELDIGSFELDDGAVHVWVNVTRSSDNIRAFADNLRLYRPDGSMADQAAFSDQQYGNFFTTGTAAVEVASGDAGTWRVTYLTDSAHQAEVHVGRTIVTAAL